jgi:hypothetical protein
VNRIFFLVLLIFFTAPLRILVAQEEDSSVTEIGQALLKADSKALSNMFMETLELETDNHKGKFSKSQAQMILRDWFQANQPSSYELRQEGKTGNSLFLIGFLHCSTTTFRVYIMFDEQQGKTGIHFLSLTKNEQ